MRQSTLQVKRIVLQETHKPGCQCGFCKNKGKIHHIVNGGAKAKAEKPEAKEEPEEPGEMQEGRDDIDKLGLKPAEKRYARMSTKNAMSGKKPQMYMDMVASVTNQQKRKKGFGIEDKGETTAGKKLESRAIRAVRQLMAE